MTIRDPKEIDVMSAHTCRVSQSLKARLPIGTLPVFGECMDALADSVPYDNYDDFGNEIEGMARICEDDIDFGSLLGRDCVELMTTLTTFPFELDRLDALPDDTNKAMNAHYITGLSMVQSRLPSNANVLVLCAGNGEDVARLTHRGLPSFANLDIVGASPFRPLAKFAVNNVPGRVRISPLYAEDLPMSHYLPSYDLILCHHGLHHVMRSQRGVDRLRELLNRLSPTGLLVGDKIDPVGLDTMAQFSFMPASGIELCGYNHTKYLEGSFNMRVNNKIWEDPVLSDRRLYDAFDGFNVNVLQGRGAFQGGANIYGDPFVPPKSVLNASRSSVTRVITYVEIMKTSPVRLSAHVTMDPKSYKLERRDKLPDSVADVMDYRVNKGLHVQVADIPYIGINSLFAEKSDGVTARVFVGEGCIYVKTVERVPRYYVGQGRTRSGLPLLRLQCEFIEGDHLRPNRLVLTDPIHLGVDCPTAFRARLNYYNSMVRESPWISNYIETKEWYSTIPREASNWEGIVIMGASTPSPIRGEKYAHTARYAKWRNTVDLAYSDGIWEVDVVTNERIRPRPDKDRPNAPSNVRHVREALTMDDVYSILAVTHDVELEARDLSILAGLHYIEPLPGVLVALRYPNRAARDPVAQRIKLQLLENVGYCPPPTYAEYRGIDEAPGVDDWLMDIGLFGGGGNSKGDGPAFDKLVSAAEEARIAYCYDQLESSVAHYFGGVVPTIVTDVSSFGPIAHNYMSKPQYNKLINCSVALCRALGRKCGTISGTSIPVFEGADRWYIVFARPYGDDFIKIWVGNTKSEHPSTDIVRSMVFSQYI